MDHIDVSNTLCLIARGEHYSLIRPNVNDSIKIAAFLRAEYIDKTGIATWCMESCQVPKFPKLFDPQIEIPASNWEPLIKFDHPKQFLHLGCKSHTWKLNCKGTFFPFVFIAVVSVDVVELLGGFGEFEEFVLCICIMIFFFFLCS